MVFDELKFAYKISQWFILAQSEWNKFSPECFSVAVKNIV